MFQATGPYFKQLDHKQLDRCAPLDLQVDSYVMDEFEPSTGNTEETYRQVFQNLERLLQSVVRIKTTMSQVSQRKLLAAGTSRVGVHGTYTSSGTYTVAGHALHLRRYR